MTIRGLLLIPSDLRYLNVFLMSVIAYVIKIKYYSVSPTNANIRAVESMYISMDRTLYTFICKISEALLKVREKKTS